MPETAINHFKEDIQRAEAILEHARALPVATADQQRLRSDLLRSSWMFAVGAMDAYFCDAHTDLPASVLMCKERQRDINLPDVIESWDVPLSAVFADYEHRENWRWRMMARKRMTKANVLSLENVKSLLNPFLRGGHRFFLDVLDDWMMSHRANARVFGVAPVQYRANRAEYQQNPDRDRGERDAKNQRTTVVGTMNKRFKSIIQRRHDCIHNCDRPNVAPQRLERAGTVRNVICDVNFLVTLCDQHIDAEFPQFLTQIGCTPQTINQVGY
ncbi:MAG: hypothetical protein ACYC35_27290 [Pirellulales bacterium]